MSTLLSLLDLDSPRGDGVRIKSPKPQVDAIGSPKNNESSVVQSTYTDCRNLMRKAYARKGLDVSSIDILLASLAENTYKQYDSVVRKWCLFCDSNNLHIFNSVTSRRRG
ncbi:uncharacterized protein LOC113464027 [Ceratina calcarata]|uniref:Uncharacterized protein LOC113464027 n=1 Tax=Ceratina calcarata TaxID=156304 RepID=A0AAJ7RXG4_9HYME|nr:uncharacterized protein LOC113464027 [Ceratina calcarata]